MELIVLVPPEEERKQRAEAPQGRGRLAALATELALEARPFRELAPEERRVRLQRLRGAGRRLMSESGEFAQHKAEEIEIEERKFGHDRF